jgi:flagellar hook-length control protein FliK
VPLFIAKQDTIAQSEEQPIPAQPPGQNLINNPPAIGVSAEITGNEFPSLATEKELSVTPQDKNWTTFTGQEIVFQPVGRNLDIQAPGIAVAKEVAGQKLNTQFTGEKITIHSPDQDVNLQTNLQTPGKPVPLEVISKNSSSLTGGNELSLLTEVKNGPAPFSQPVVSSLTNQKPDFSHFLEPLASSLNPPLKIDLTGVQSQNAHTPLPGIGQNQTLLQQLQQIINNGNETGTVTIEATASSYSFQYRGVAGAKLGDIASSQVQEPGRFGEKPGSKIPALRQDMLGQYFEAKLSTKEQSNSAPNTQTNDQQNSATSQQAAASQQPNPAVLPEQASSFQNMSALMQDIQTNQSQSSIKPVILPSGTVVDQDNVIQQVAERFQITNRANDIKLNLKLHPEELGELKIDLTLKEGSIKGNIVAQSQQILEIIEKNMIKLRSILEDQGFTVEEIVVTSESDSVTDFELFEQHLSQQSDLTPSFTDSQQDNDFDGALEDAVVQSADSLTGVNIKA